MAGKKILIVDPDREYASRLAAAMVAEEYDVVIATDAVQGFEVFRTQAPDLVIASLQLPGGGGIQVHQRIKRIGRVTLPIRGTATSETRPGHSAPRRSSSGRSTPTICSPSPASC